MAARPLFEPRGPDVVEQLGEVAGMSGGTSPFALAAGAVPLGSGVGSAPSDGSLMSSSSSPPAVVPFVCEPASLFGFVPASVEVGGVDASVLGVAASGAAASALGAT